MPWGSPGGCSGEGFALWGHSVKAESPAGFALASVTARSCQPSASGDQQKLHLLPSREAWDDLGTVVMSLRCGPLSSVGLGPSVESVLMSFLEAKL